MPRILETEERRGHAPLARRQCEEARSPTRRRVSRSNSTVLTRATRAGIAITTLIYKCACLCAVVFVCSVSGLTSHAAPVPIEIKRDEEDGKPNAESLWRQKSRVASASCDETKTPRPPAARQSLGRNTRDHRRDLTFQSLRTRQVRPAHCLAHRIGEDFVFSGLDAFDDRSCAVGWGSFLHLYFLCHPSVDRAWVDAEYFGALRAKHHASRLRKRMSCRFRRAVGEQHREVRE